MSTPDLPRTAEGLEKYVRAAMAKATADFLHFFQHKRAEVQAKLDVLSARLDRIEDKIPPPPSTGATR